MSLLWVQLVWLLLYQAITSFFLNIALSVCVCVCLPCNGLNGRPRPPLCSNGFICTCLPPDPPQSAPLEKQRKSPSDQSTDMKQWSFRKTLFIISTNTRWDLTCSCSRLQLLFFCCKPTCSRNMFHTGKLCRWIMNEELMTAYYWMLLRQNTFLVDTELHKTLQWM